MKKSEYEQDDWTLAEKVRDSLAEDGRLRDSQIRVSVRGGVVHMVGRVRSHVGRDAAESDARHVDGVVTVDNRLRVERAAPAG